MTFKLQTAAASEPVTTEELKAQLRITHSSQDTMLASLIKAARQRAEFYTRRALITSVWDLFLDSFPDSGDCIWIRKCPVSVVTSVKYYDTSNTLQTWASTNWVSDVNDEPASIYEAYGKTYPMALAIKNAVQIRFSAGYANAAAVPEDLKRAVLMIAAHLFENPADIVSGTQINEVPQSSKWLMEPYKIKRY